MRNQIRQPDYGASPWDIDFSFDIDLSFSEYLLIGAYLLFIAPTLFFVDIGNYCYQAVKGFFSAERQPRVHSGAQPKNMAMISKLF